jgi:hypothetical protein
MFTVALIRIGKLQNQPRYPATDERIKLMWCMHTMSFYSAKKEYEIMLFEGERMEMEIIMLSHGQILHVSLICRI